MSAVSQCSVAEMEARLKRILDIEIEKLTEKLSKKMQEDIEFFSKQMKDDFAKRVEEMKNGSMDNAKESQDYADGEEKKDDSEEDPNNIEIAFNSFEDAKRNYNEAFNSCGGEEALRQCKDTSQDLHEQVVSKIIEVEIEKLMPQSMAWNGASKYLVNQSYVQSIEELYEKAAIAHGTFEAAMNEIASGTTPPCKANIPPLKDTKRAQEKARFKYADEVGEGVAYYRLTDIVRGTLIFEDIWKMYDGLKAIESCEHFDIVEFNDRFQTPMRNTGGYRDIQLTLKLKTDGFLCELQLSTDCLTKIKQTYGHRDYEVHRQLAAAVKDRDRDQIEATLLFCHKQLGSSFRMKKKFLPPRCHPLAHEAAKMGEAEILDRLIECGADCNAQDKQGNTPLHHAVYYGHERCVWLLLDKHNCEKNIYNDFHETALMRGYAKFYSQPSEQTRRAIATLLQKTDLKQVEETTKAFQRIIKSRLRKSKELVDSASVGNVEKMRELLRTYADPDSDRGGRTALVEAVSNSHASAVKLLAEFNVSISRDVLLHPPKENQYEIAKLLIDKCSKPENYIFSKDTIQCRVGGERKWDGIASYGTKLFCVPYCASSILIIDSETKEIRPIPCGVDGESKWSGIATYGSKLFCAPCNASSVLVIDGETETVHHLPCGVDGKSKWSGIARCGTKLFCAPSDASSILVIDGETEKTHTIPCEVGKDKWAGIARYGTKLFCAPSDAKSILVIDGDTEKTHTIPCEVEGENKWEGIAVCGTKLFCAPSFASSVLVIDGSTETIETIACGVEGIFKWSGIANCGRKLICAPSNAGNMLVIDGDTNAIHTIPYELQGDFKFRGIAECGAKLFCAPCNASSVVVMKAVRDLPSIVQSWISHSQSSQHESLDLVQSASSGDVEDMKGLLCGFANPNSCGQDGFPLELAARNGHEAAVDLLLDFNASVSHHAAIEAISNKHTEIAETLLRRLGKPNVLFGPALIQCGADGNKQNWRGITSFGTKLFCAPYRSSSILVIDSETEKTHTISCGVKGKHKWSGITQFGSKLFCAPYFSNEILVIDGDTEKAHTIPSGVKMDQGKWCGIANYGDKLFCAPCYANAVLVIDGKTEKTRRISCREKGDYKWSGIAKCGTKLFCAPSNSSSILVIDGDKEKANTIACGVEGKHKWSGIAKYGNKLFCAPWNASDILVINGVTESIHTIPCGVEGEYKWRGIVCCGKKLLCAPFNASCILVIDGETEKIETIPISKDGSHKWAGIASNGSKLFCAPHMTDSILAVKEHHLEVIEGKGVGFASKGSEAVVG